MYIRRYRGNKWLPSMKIIFIHGMNQQHYSAQTLRQHWLQIFQQGLRCSQYSAFCLSTARIEQPFYGDLLTQHHQQNVLDLNTFLPKAWLNFPLHLQQTEQKAIEHSDFIPFLPHDSVSQNLPISARLNLYSALAKDIMLKELSILLNHFPQLHEKLIHQFLIEAYLYLSNECFLREVHARILSCMSAHQKHIVVAHSLGSVIAYNLLHMHPEFQVCRFITLGSPLAFRIIQDKILHPIIRPKGIHGDWMNFYSHDDFLTAFPLSNAPFCFKPAIINQMISTFANKPHEITGYLQHPDVVKSIVEPLQKR